MIQDEELLAVRFGELIKPSNLFKDFTKKEFLEYAKSGNTESLKALLAELEKEEMYEHCTVVNKIIKSRI